RRDPPEEPPFTLLLSLGPNIPPESPHRGDLVQPPESLSTLERLAQATGGTEKSWYRCVFPFGVVSLVIGVAGTGVTFMYNTPDLHQTKVVSMVLLVIGMVMLLMAAVCWRDHRLKRRKKKEGGREGSVFTVSSSESSVNG
uniref:Transmembrane protein 100 n=1 Tax=Salmo trutta TaxID=8032 RepID=A0A674F8A9_SALTR